MRLFPWLLAVEKILAPDRPADHAERRIPRRDSNRRGRFERRILCSGGKSSAFGWPIASPRRVDRDQRLIDWANETRAKINKLQKHRAMDRLLTNGRLWSQEARDAVVPLDAQWSTLLNRG
jgi:hypothetical protein